MLLQLPDSFRAKRLIRPASDIPLLQVSFCQSMANQNPAHFKHTPIPHTQRVTCSAFRAITHSTRPTASLKALSSAAIGTTPAPTSFAMTTASG